MEWITTLILLLFVGLLVGLIFHTFLLPRDTSILNELAGNRLRIPFVDPPPPKTPVETAWRHILNLLDEEGYGVELEPALGKLNELLAKGKDEVEEFIALESSVIKLFKLVGCTSFELSKRKRTEQDYKNVEAVFACIRSLADHKEGLEAITATNNAVFDMHLACSYVHSSTLPLAYSVLNDVINHSTKGYEQFLSAADDVMYNPVKEEYLLASLVQRLSEAGDSKEAHKVEGLKLLESLLKSPHAGESSAMLRSHFSAYNFEEKLQSLRGDEQTTALVESITTEIKTGEQKTPTFHQTPHDVMSCYSHMFSSRVRFFARALNCLWTVLPGKLPSSVQPIPEEVRQKAVMRMKELRDRKRTGTCSTDEVQAMNREMSAMTLGVEPSFFDEMLEAGMFEQTRVFIDEAEAVENWNHEELLQAGRNVWTCFGLQMILYKEDVKMSDAYLGYSLLYPYTDNYLDDEAITKETKKTFQDLFTQRLAGKPVKARSPLEQKIWDMVAKVENVFDRSKFPDPFNAMIAINEAQTKSLAQHSKVVPPEEFIQEITMEKGGTSVLTDGYLVRGEMTEEDALFAFGLGVALQFVDDLQDTLKDTEVNHHTLFTLGWARKEASDIKAMKMLQLLSVFVNPESYDIDEKAANLRRCLLKMTNTICMKAMAKYCYIFTEGFVEKMASFTPIPMQHLQRVNNMARMLQMVRNNQI